MLPAILEISNLYSECHNVLGPYSILVETRENHYEVRGQQEERNGRV
jgi:hypothetical protein